MPRDGIDRRRSCAVVAPFAMPTGWLCDRPDAGASLRGGCAGCLSDPGRATSCGSTRSIWRLSGSGARAARGEIVGAQECWHDGCRFGSDRSRAVSRAGATLQDAGRHGYLRFGVTAAGPIGCTGACHGKPRRRQPRGFDGARDFRGWNRRDRRIRNRFVLPVAGGEFHAQSRRQAAAGAAGSQPGMKAPPLKNFGAGRSGSWAHMAGGGSLRRAEGARLSRYAYPHRLWRRGRPRARSRAIGLGIERSGSSEQSIGAIVAPWLDRPVNVIRVVLGPQHDYFADDQIAAFLPGPGPSPSSAIAWRIFSKDPADACARLQHRVRRDRLGRDPGAGRRPSDRSDGRSSIDRGYPKIATIIGPDLGRLAQAGRDHVQVRISVDRASGSGTARGGGLAGARHRRRAPGACALHLGISARPQSDRRCRRLDAFRRCSGSQHD